MPALDPVVTDFLTRINDSLSTGPDTSTPGPGNINAAPLNYLRAQDMASVLDLLQDGLDTGTLPATGGTARSVQDTGAFTADQQIGNVVIFDGNNTAALAGIEARVVSNTTGELFFADAALPATPVSGDTYTIRGGLVDSAISELRQGTGLADSPRGSVYGDYRVVSDALVRVFAQLSGNTDPFSLAFELERKMSPEGFFGVAAGATVDVIPLKEAPAGAVITNLRIDQFRGFKAHIAGASDADVRRVVRSDETSITLNKPFTAAPGEDLPVQISVPLAGAETVRDIVGSAATHAGSQPGENAYLAEIIDRVQIEVVAYTTPT